MEDGRAHRMQVRVYYEDTDLAGIVYYANYLRYIERGRTEALREYGVDQGRLKHEEGVVFAVRRLSAEYLRPARFDDVLTVETTVARVGGAVVEMAQDVIRDGETLFQARVTIVCMDAMQKPVRIPARIRAIFAQISRGGDAAARSGSAS